MNEHVLVTERLTLRPSTREDAAAPYELWMLPQVRRFLWDDQQIPPEETGAIVQTSVSSFASQDYGLWLIEERTKTQDVFPFVGFVGLWHFEEDHPQLLYGLHPSVIGRGFATEASRAVSRYAFRELGFDSVIAACDPPNSSSIAVLERLGFISTGFADLKGRPTQWFSLRKPAGSQPTGRIE